MDYLQDFFRQRVIPTQCLQAPFPLGNPGGHFKESTQYCACFCINAMARIGLICSLRTTKMLLKSSPIFSPLNRWLLLIAQIPRDCRTTLPTFYLLAWGFPGWKQHLGTANRVWTNIPCRHGMVFSILAHRGSRRGCPGSCCLKTLLKWLWRARWTSALKTQVPYLARKQGCSKRQQPLHVCCLTVLQPCFGGLLQGWIPRPIQTCQQTARINLGNWATKSQYISPAFRW